MSVVIRPQDVFKEDNMKCWGCNYYDSSVNYCNAEDVCYMEVYEKGFAKGSLSVTEQIINEKVIKYFEEKKSRLDNNPYFGNTGKIKLLNEIIENFKEATK